MHKAYLLSHIVPQPMLIKPKNKNGTCSQKIKSLKIPAESIDYFTVL